MRIIIELDPGTRISNVASDTSSASDTGVINTGPPRFSQGSSAASRRPAASDAPQEAAGPPAALVAQIEAAQMSAEGAPVGAGAARYSH
jgi:hypothetical protein